MAKKLQPRKVAKNSWRKWCRQAFELQSRAKAANILSALLWVLFYMLLVEVDNLAFTVIAMLIAAPATLSVFVLLAARADHRNILITNESRLRITIRVLFLGLVNWALLILVFGTLFMLGYLVAGMFGLSIGDSASVAGKTVEANAINSTVGGSVINNPYLFLAALVYTIIPLTAWYAQSLFPYTSIWFVLILAMTSPLNVYESYKLSWQAEQLNWSEVNSLSMLSLALLSLILVSGGILALLVLPFLGSLLYVSFRDVFLGEAENFVVVKERLTDIVQPPEHSNVNV